MGMDVEIKWLKKAGIKPELLDSGCCGMAGSFGFEKDKYEVSVKCGEHVLLPKVREAAPETLIVASAFSCQEQIEQLTHRHALHFAQVLQMAAQPQAQNGKYPETPYVQARKSAVRASMQHSGMALAGAAAALGAAAWMITRRAA